ncbi:MAG: hypothetical protein ACRELB_20765 [Polyangiaceae bacterium]
MTSVRWRALVAIALLATAPTVGLVSCGSSESNSPGSDGGGSGDGTTDALGSDGTRGDSSGDGAGQGDAAGDQQNTEGGTQCSDTCPPTVTCGHYTTCSGITIACGTPCPKGQVCTGSGNSQACQTPVCTGKCGVIGTDSCGVGISCGGCPTGQACVANQCVTQTAGEAGAADAGCGILTCTPDQSITLCGTITDGCGNTKQCSCPSGQQCIGNVCGTPSECDPGDGGADGGAGAKCGSVPNACGSGNVNCGGCTGANKCQNGICVGCTAPACGSVTCGSVSNGCGPTVSCGTCGTGEDCYDGGCCQPLTCGEAVEAGIVNGCGAVDLGCEAAEELLRLRLRRDLLRRRMLPAARLRGRHGRRPGHRMRSGEPRLRPAEVVRPLPLGRCMPEERLRRLPAQDVRKLRRRRVQSPRQLRKSARLLRGGHGLPGGPVLPAGRDQPGRRVLPRGRGQLQGLVLPAHVRPGAASGATEQLRRGDLLRRRALADS